MRDWRRLTGVQYVFIFVLRLMTGIDFLHPQLDFEVVLISADPKAGSMRMDWRILSEVNSPCRPDNTAACSEVEVMFDTYVHRPHSTLPNAAI